MELFDTHCHIQSAGLKEGEQTTRELWAKDNNVTINDLVERAKEAGVTRLMCVGCDTADSELAVACARDRDGLFAAIGIHPHEAQHVAGRTDQKQAFAALATALKVVAVGECGLDYFYAHSPREAQIEILKFQLDLALEHDLPLIFHVRDAFDDFWEIFDSYPSGSVRGVLHSFTDSLENMQRAVASGLFIGVNGIATFVKEEQKRVMYRTIPLDSLLLETDSPFLTPTPYRGNINEPKHIRTIAEFLESIRSESQNEIAEATTRNARALFSV